MVSHWNGTFWDEHQVVSDGKIDLAAIAMLSPSRVWVGGATSTPYSTPGVLFEWNGSTWTGIQAGGGAIQDIVALSPSDVWTVGFSEDEGDYRAMVARWDGSRWLLRFWAASHDQPGNATGFTTAGGHRWVVANSSFIYSCSHVDLDEHGLTPPTNLLDVGELARWRVDPDSTSPRSVEDRSGLSLFSSGPIAPGEVYTYRYPGAGRYLVAETTADDRGWMEITPVVRQVRGFHVRVRTLIPNAEGIVADVKMRKGPQWNFRTIRTGISEPFVDVPVAEKAGETYEFISRVRSSEGRASSKWSRATSVTVVGWARIRSLDVDPDPVRTGERFTVSGRLVVRGGPSSDQGIYVVIKDREGFAIVQAFASTDGRGRFRKSFSLQERGVYQAYVEWGGGDGPYFPDVVTATEQFEVKNRP